MRALGRKTQRVRDTGVRREIRAADERGSSAGVDSAPVSAPEPGIEGKAASRCLTDSRRLRGDERLVVQMVEQRALENLRHGSRTFHHDDRNVLVHDASFRYRAGVAVRPVRQEV